MKIDDLIKPLKIWLKKGKYPLIVALVGLVLILMPKEGAKQAASESSQDDFDLSGQEKRIAEVLSKIDGAGDVEVVLTLNVSSQNVIAQDRQTSSQKSEDDEKSEVSTTAVKVSPQSARQEVVVLHRIYPEYRGALVVAQGADNNSVRLSITDAVADLTGLGSDKITVIKMKN